MIKGCEEISCKERPSEVGVETDCGKKRERLVSLKNERDGGNSQEQPGK